MSTSANNDDLRANMHRFRVRGTSRTAGADSISAHRRRSASPPVEPLPRDRELPACDRCRTFKKKCSRTFPVCSLCASAGHDCSFSVPVSSAKAQTHHLRARVEWLSRLVDDNILLSGCSSIQGIGTGADLTGLLVASTPPSAVPVASAQGHTSATTPESSTNREYDALARTLVDAYFRHIHRAYPFMNRARVFRDLEAAGSTVWPPKRADSTSTLLFLVMALGCTTLQRSGQMPREATNLKFQVPSAEIVQECLLKDDLESVQILVLLALYCLYDPAATSTWTIAGIAARKAMSCGLSRRVSSDSTLSSTEKEFRYRLFWSTWVLDRVMAYSTGLPPGLCDDGIDVPLPGLAVEEFASPERQRFASVLQTHRHIIHLRRLEDRVLAQILSRKQPDTAVAQNARLAAVKEMRSEIEDWYSEGCLLAPVEPDNIPIHTSVAWLSARYYHLLLVLHYPCPYNGSGAMVSALDLLRFVQKHLRSTLVLLQQRQLPLNMVTLARTLPVGLIYIHVLMSGVSASAPPLTEEVDTLIGVLEAFPDHWTHARRAAQVFRQVRLAIVEAGPRPPYQPLLKPPAAAVTSIMEDVAGKTTAYDIPEFLCRRGSSGDGGVYSSSSPADPIQSSMASVHDEMLGENDFDSLQFAFL